MSVNPLKNLGAKYSPFYWWKLKTEAKYSAFYWSEAKYVTESLSSVPESLLSASKIPLCLLTKVFVARFVTLNFLQNIYKKYQIVRSCTRISLFGKEYCCLMSTLWHFKGHKVHTSLDSWRPSIQGGDFWGRLVWRVGCIFSTDHTKNTKTYLFDLCELY